MRAMTWTCDRCGAKVEVPEKIILVEEYSPAAVTGFTREWHHLDGWERFYDDESVVDVCPNCVTAGERADRLFHEAEMTVMFARRRGVVSMTAQLVFDLEAALEDVEHQRALDRRGADANGRAGAGVMPRTPTLDYVKVRMAAVLRAAAEPGEEYAYRQSLVDLSAVCAELAATMRQPVSPSARP